MQISKTLTFSILAMASVSAAEPDGEATYKQMCASCHGVDGTGAAAGTFPPLKGSEWLAGDGQRAAKILLHGLSGPVEVKGKTYNLAMPAQGALSDKQKVAVLNFIRSSWSAERDQFTLEDLAVAKEASAKRTKPWTAKELLKIHPLPRPISPLKNLLMTTYKGRWEGLPNWSQLKPEATEEEHDGYISLKKINWKTFFGVVWEGQLEVEKQSEYEFRLDSNDGSRLVINGKTVTEINTLGALGRPEFTKLTLAPGKHSFRLEFFQSGGGSDISLKWRKAGGKWKWLSDPVAEHRVPKFPLIDLSPKDNSVALYNNFIKGASARTLGVGFQHQQNIAYSTEHCSPDLIWKGAFISAGRHWTSRGIGVEPPLSKDVIKLNNGNPWKVKGKSVKPQFKGYTLAKDNNPTFSYMLEGLTVTENFTSSKDSLIRQIVILSPEKQSLQLRIASTKEPMSIDQKPLSLGIGKSLTLQLPATKAQLKQHENKAHTILSLEKGSNTFNFTYKWKN